MDTSKSSHHSESSTSDSHKRRQEIAALIARLMGHYWTADDDPASRRAQAEDWIDDLIEFDVGDVQNACVEWRRSQSRRPTPSDVRLIAIAEQRNRLARIELHKLPYRHSPKPADVKHPWEPGYTARYDEPWFRALDAATRQRYMAQDQARLDVHNRILDGHAAPGEFAALCRAQAAENLSPQKRHPPSARDHLNALGVRVSRRSAERPPGVPAAS